MCARIAYLEKNVRFLGDWYQKGWNACRNLCFGGGAVLTHEVGRRLSKELTNAITGKLERIRGRYSLLKFVLLYEIQLKQVIKTVMSKPTVQFSFRDPEFVTR